MQINTKICKVCKVEKDISCFSITHGNHFLTCKPCMNAQSKIRCAREHDHGVTVIEKQCSCCKQIKKADAFVICKDTPSGLKSACKDCRKKQETERNKKIQNITHKICKHCLETKPVTEYHKVGYGNYKAICKECLKEVANLRSVRAGSNKQIAKTCIRCKETKPGFEFTVSNYNKDGLHNTCRSCCNKKKSIIKQNKKVPETKCCAACKETKASLYFIKSSFNLDGLAAVCKLCAKQERDHRVSVYKQNRLAVTTKVCFNCKIEKNKTDFQERLGRKNGLSHLCKECLAAVRKEYYIKYAKTNVYFKLVAHIRSRISAALKNIKKINHSVFLLGCSPTFFKDYFESKFTGGMTWELFLKGKIHIDHIIPCAYFDLSKKHNQIMCFNYKNTQPLWSKDNIKKNDALIWNKHTLALKTELEKLVGCSLIPNTQYRKRLNYDLK